MQNVPASINAILPPHTDAIEDEPIIKDKYKNNSWEKTSQTHVILKSHVFFPINYTFVL